MSITSKRRSSSHEKPFEQLAPAVGGAGANVNPGVPGPMQPVTPLSDAGNSQPRARTEALPAAPARSQRRVALAVRVAGLFLLCAVDFTVAGPRYAWSQAPAGNPETEAAPASWTILFRADDPSLWDTASKGKAVPLERAPDNFRYLRLRRMDTGEALILRLTPAELKNGKAPTPEASFWWNGTAKKDWEGRHLGIVQAPRHKFPAPKGMIGVMTEGWDAFTGSGFGHKCFVNDKQYYCWRGQEIPRTVFEIAVSDGPLSPEEKRCLLKPGAGTVAPATGQSATNTFRAARPRTAVTVVAPATKQSAPAPVARSLAPSDPLYNPVTIARLLYEQDGKKELKITKEQEPAIKACLAKWQEKFGKDADTISKMTGAGKQARFNALLGQEAGELLRSLGPVLTPGQTKRLKQILLQLKGIGVFDHPEICQALELSSEQAANLKAIHDHMEGEILDEARAGRIRREEAHKQINALSQGVSDRVRAALTEQQRKVLQDLLGEPFALQ